MPAHRFHGLEIPIRKESGARAIRVVHPPNQTIQPHRHDWPLLTLPLIGGYREDTEQGSVAIDGPAAIFHPAGCCHANCIHDRGMETFSIEFDLGWLGRERPPLDGSRIRIGGSAALAARKAVAAWCDPASSVDCLQQATVNVVAALFAEPAATTKAHWISSARSAAGREPTAAIADGLGFHPAWLAREYRRVTGEGLRETARRLQVEQAVHMLRDGDDSIAEIAAASGFCDQSHLNRAFAKFLGRTPLQVRGERDRISRATN